MARVQRQAAVVPYRIRKRRVEVALVTTSTGRGWIVPKGSVDDGERPREAAIREAEEEAGLLGVLARKPLGRYQRDNGDGSCRVDVYLMRVTGVLDHWLEDRLRRRRWMRIPDAAACLRADLRQFVRAVESVLTPTWRSAPHPGPVARGRPTPRTAPSHLTMHKTHRGGSGSRA
ncbi:MAG TPA: NUDIX domain-containing protein, partial [Vicinamibacterales bacterium]|nr:NUDIX domain-containing protein [Vicinamibacterales bacterium]